MATNTIAQKASSLLDIKQIVNQSTVKAYKSGKTVLFIFNNMSVSVGDNISSLTDYIPLYTASGLITQNNGTLILITISDTGTISLVDMTTGHAPTGPINVYGQLVYFI